jgi:hypothetical protein
MRYSIVLAAAGWIVLNGVAFAQAPKGPAPVLKIVRSVDAAKGNIEFRDLTYKVELRTETRKVLVNGKEVEENVVVQVMVPVEMQTIVQVANSRIVTPDGKAVPADDVWKRVKAKTVVVFSGNNELPDPAYLRALSADTVIIIPAPAAPPKK